MQNRKNPKDSGQTMNITMKLFHNCQPLFTQTPPFDYWWVRQVSVVPASVVHSEATSLPQSNLCVNTIGLICLRMRCGRSLERREFSSGYMILSTWAGVAAELKLPFPFSVGPVIPGWVSQNNLSFNGIIITYITCVWRDVRCIMSASSWSGIVQDKRLVVKLLFEEVISNVASTKRMQTLKFDLLEHLKFDHAEL